MSRKPALIKPTGLNYLNRGKERKGDDGEKRMERHKS